MKHKYKAPPHIRVLVFCIIFTIIWNVTPIQASVTDNLNSIVVKILGQKNETTTKSNYQNASLAAKLNYLETEMANLKTKVEISGGVAKCIEDGTIDTGCSKTFSGPGYILVDRGDRLDTLVVDGVVIDDRGMYSSDGNKLKIDFRESVVITTEGGYTNPDVYRITYIYYKY